MTHEAYQPLPDYRLRLPPSITTQQISNRHLDPRVRNVFTTNEQGDSPPYVEGTLQDPPRKKKVLILEINDILPSHQRDRMSDEGLEEN